MRFAWRVQPRNMLLFACHFVNSVAQGAQTVRLLNYKYGRGASLAENTEKLVGDAEADANKLGGTVRKEAEQALNRGQAEGVKIGEEAREAVAKMREASKGALEQKH